MEKTKTIKKTTKAVVKKASVPVQKKTEAKNMEAKTSRQILTGTVVSTKMQKTVVVAIHRKVAHKLYGKLINVTSRIKADTNGMDLVDGDVVVIEQSKPMSKNKNFIVTKKGAIK